MRGNKIRLKVFALIFITLIPLSVLKIVDIRYRLNSSIEAELQASQDFAEAINLSFMNFLNKTWTSQYIIGNSLLSHPEWKEKEIENYLDSILPTDEAMLTYTWVDAKGNVVASTSPSLRGTNLLDRDYINRILDGEEKVVSNLRISNDGKDVIVPIARSIRVGNELKGIIISVLDVNDIKYIFPMKRLGESSTFGLIDSNAVMVYRNNNSDMPFEKRAVSADSPARKALKGEIVKTYARYSGFDGTEKMGIDYPIKDIGWSCFVTTSVGSLLAGEISALKKDLTIFILVFMMSFILATLLSRKYVSSINKLKKAEQEVMNGNLDYKLPVNPEDDLADVENLFNSMIDNLKQRERDLEEYNNLKSQFLSTMSHELKTPLNIILGCIQLMERLDIKSLDLNNSISRYIRMQKQNSFRLLRLINNIIDINKSEGNQMQLRLANGDIISVVENITLSIVEYTKLKEIEVVFDTELEEKIIAFDSDMLERVMLNLLSNAIKFTEPGGSIHVNIYDKENKIQISVKDTGIGIPKNKQETIFDRFTQVDNSLRRKSEGSGIGLSLVKYLVELHGGTISVSSELGKGSEFIIELPDRTVESEAGTASDKGITNVERINVEFSDIYM